MSNCSYLCYWKDKTLYPNLCKGYDANINTLAIGSETVPLLWLSLFNKNDWHTRNFTVDGEVILAQGPITTIESALDNLNNAKNCLIPMLSENGLTEEPFRCLYEYIKPHKGNYITIESEEIALMDTDEDKYYRNMQTLIKGFSLGKDMLTNPNFSQFKELLIKFLEFEKPLMFYPLHEYIDNTNLNENDFRNFEVLIGSELYRSVPWWGSEHAENNGAINEECYHKYEEHKNLGKIFLVAALFLLALLLIVIL
jgi:hypothetical protein